MPKFKKFQCDILSNFQKIENAKKCEKLETFGKIEKIGKIQKIEQSKIWKITTIRKNRKI